MQRDIGELTPAGAFIGGRWMDTSATYDVRDPASLEIIASIAKCGAVQATQAVDAAATAAADWAARTASERAMILQRWGELMLSHLDALAMILTREQGKPLEEARGEIRYAAGFLQWFAEEAHRQYGDVIPSRRPGARIVVLRQPVGVVAAITPWNFPSAMITRKVGAALAAGCTVVIKPSELTPCSAHALAVLGEDAGIPPGVLNIVSGEPAAIGETWMSDRRVRKLSFTGSVPVGRLLMGQAAETLKRVSLELGGNAPFIVFDDADIAAAVDGAMASKFRNAGQTCVCANRFYVADEVYDDFVERLSAAVGALVVGPGTQVGVDQGPLIDAGALAKVRAHVDDAVARGGRILVGGQPHARGGTYFEPTVIAEATSDMRVACEETFGPLAAVFRFTSEEEVIAMANDTDVGLAAYFYTRDLGRAWRVAEALEVGMVGVNAGKISTPVAPFGGVKASGLGREGSRYGLDEYTELKYVMFAGVS